MELQDLLPNVRNLQLLPHIRDLAIAYALAFVIGWNREREDRSAGCGPSRSSPSPPAASCRRRRACSAASRRRWRGSPRA